jgi:WD40 repeat protein
MDNKKELQNLLDETVSKEEINLLKQDLASGQQRERRLRWAVVALVVAATIFLVLTSFGWVKSKEAKSQSATAQSDTYRALMLFGTAAAQKGDAEEQAKVALAREIALRARLSWDRSVAILLATESMRLSPTGEASQVIWDALETPIFQSRTSSSSAFFERDSGTVVSIGSDSLNTVRIWDVLRGEEIAHLAQTRENVNVAISPNFRDVASVTYDQASRTSTTLVRKINSVRESTLKSHVGYVSSTVFSPDGNNIASVERLHKDDATRKAIRVWNVATGEDVTLAEFKDMNNGDVFPVVFSPDGLYLLTSMCDQIDKERGWCIQGSVHVWEVSTGKEVARMIHKGRITAAEFSSDATHIVSSSSEDTARVWDVVSGKEISHASGGAVHSATFSPDGNSVASVGRPGIRIWEAGTGKEILHLPVSGSVGLLRFSPDGKFLAFVSDVNNNTYIVSVREVATGKEVMRLRDSYIGSLAFSPDGKYLLVAGKEVKVWEIFPGQIGVPSILYSFPPGKRHMVALKDNSPFILDVEGNNYQEMRSFGFSSDGKYLVMGNTDGTVSVLEVATGNKISYPMHSASIGAVAISPNGKYVISGSGDNTARLWEAATGKEIAHMVHSAPVSSVAFSPDGRYAASGSYDTSVYVWDTLTGKEVAHVVGMFVVFSPDSRYVVSGGANGIVSLWEVATGKEIMHILSDGGKAFFTPDGDYLIIEGQATVSVWDMATGREISRVPYPFDSTLLGLSSDVERLLFVGNENIVEMKWRPEDLIVDACSRVTRNLTSVEWQQYIGDVLPYQEVCPNFQLEPTLMPIPTPTPIPTSTPIPTPTPTASPTPTPAPNPTSTTQPTET